MLYSKQNAILYPLTSKVLHFTSITNSLGKKRGYNHYTYYIQYKLFCKFQGNHSNKMIKFM